MNIRTIAVRLAAVFALTAAFAVAPSITSPSIVAPSAEVAVSWNSIVAPSITSPSIVAPSAEQIAGTSPSATGQPDVSWHS